MHPLPPTLHWLLLCAFTALWAIAQEPAPEAEKHDLRLVWETGKVYTQETDTETTTALTSLGQASDQKLFLKQTTSIQVTKGRDAVGKEALVTFESMLGEMEFDGKRFLFDSSRPEESHPLLRSTFGSGAGRSFVLVYNEDDEFQDVRDTAPPATAGEPVPLLLSLAESREMANLFRRSLEMGLPRTPVTVGDRWTSDEAMAFPKAGKMKVQLKCKFDEIVDRDSRPHAKITFQGHLQSDLGDASELQEGAAPASGSTVVMNPDSNLSGQVFFDLKRRTVSVAVFLANLNLRIQDARLPVRQKVTTRLLDVQPLQQVVPAAKPAAE